MFSLRRSSRLIAKHRRPTPREARRHPPLLASLSLLAAIGLWPIATDAQNPLVTLPHNYWSVLDNNDVQVIRAHYGAHEKVPVHDHPSVSTVFVYLNDSGQVRLDHEEPDGKVESVIRPPTVKGSYRVAPGIAERHSIENISDTSSDFLRVELKHVSLSELKEPFRGKAPLSLATNAVTTEFTAPGLQIERIICARPSPCPVKPSPAASLIIAFTPLSLATGSAVSEKLEAGTVRWLPPSQSSAVAPNHGVPGHILRILLPVGSK